MEWASSFELSPIHKQKMIDDVPEIATAQNPKSLDEFPSSGENLKGCQILLSVSYKIHCVEG